MDIDIIIGTQMVAKNSHHFRIDFVSGDADLGLGGRFAEEN